jgi:aspartate/methionine/tyrosine aminotransferase
MKEFNLNPNLSGLESNIVLEILHRIRVLEAKGINVIDLAFPAPKFDTPKIILAAASEVLKYNRMVQPSFSGLPELKTEICDYIDRTRGFRPKLNQILIGPGRRCLLFSILFSILNRGDSILTLNPGAPSHISIAKLLGAKVKYLPSIVEGQFKLDLSHLPELLGKNTKGFLFSTPQNPTGNLLSNAELQEIFTISEKKETLVISDETFSQIIYSGTHVSPAIFDGAMESSIIVEDLSYELSMPGWCLGFCVGPVKLMEKLQNFISNIFPTVPEFIQYAAAKALSIEEELFPELLSRYKKCCSNMINGLNGVPGFKCSTPKGSMFAFPDITGTNMTTSELAEVLLENVGVAVLPGELFGYGARNHVRISFATSEEQINEGLTRLQEQF